MNMLVYGQGNARLYLYKIDGIVCGMNELGKKAGRYFFCLDVAKMLENAGVHNDYFTGANYLLMRIFLALEDFFEIILPLPI